MVEAPGRKPGKTMLEDTPSRKRAVSPPVLILEDDMIRAGEMLAEIEDLGLRGKIVPARTGLEKPTSSDIFSLALLSVRSMNKPDLRVPEAVRQYRPDIPLLLICADGDAGSPPWTSCTVIKKKGALKQLKARVADILGIVLSDEPGTTMKNP
jgi:hypothetical protein